MESYFREPEEGSAIGVRLVEYLHSIRPLLPNSQIDELDRLLADLEHLHRMWEIYDGDTD